MQAGRKRAGRPRACSRPTAYMLPFTVIPGITKTIVTISLFSSATVNGSLAMITIISPAEMQTIIAFSAIVAIFHTVAGTITFVVLLCLTVNIRIISLLSTVSPAKMLSVITSSALIRTVILSTVITRIERTGLTSATAAKRHGRAAHELRLSVLPLIRALILVLILSEFTAIASWRHHRPKRHATKSLLPLILAF